MNESSSSGPPHAIKYHHPYEKLIMSESSKLLLTSCYVRDIERREEIKNIPKEITNIISSYVILDRQWNEKYSHNRLTIYNQRILNIYSNECMTAYGFLTVSDGIYKWKIKILSLNMVNTPWDKGSYPPYIGLIEDNKQYMQQGLTKTDWYRYGYQITRYRSLLCRKESVAMNCYMYHQLCKWNKSGDILEITLDLNEKTISFKLNDEDFGIAFRNVVKTNYRLAISVTNGGGSSFELL